LLVSFDVSLLVLFANIRSELYRRIDC